MAEEGNLGGSLLGTVEKDAKAQVNLRGLLASYSYHTPTGSSTPSLPRRSPRNLLSISPSKGIDSAVKTEAGSVILPLTPSSLPKRPRAPSPSTKKRKREAEDDDCLPLPPTPQQPHPQSRSQKAAKKQKRGYAPPETYAHLKGLPDHVALELDVFFCGINPGYKSAESGAHYAHPANHFWKCLHQGGFTTTLLPPSDGYLLPEKYNVGLTNIVERPSAEAGELSKAEIEASVEALLYKLRQYRPRVVCLVGKLVWDAVVRALAKRITGPLPPGLKKAKGSKGSTPFVYDCLQPYKLVHAEGSVIETLFFVVPSTSGRVVSHQLTDKVKLFSKLKLIVENLKGGTCDTFTFRTIDLPTVEPLAPAAAPTEPGLRTP